MGEYYISLSDSYEKLYYLGSKKNFPEISSIPLKPNIFIAYLNDSCIKPNSKKLVCIKSGCSTNSNPSCHSDDYDILISNFKDSEWSYYKLVSPEQVDYYQSDEIVVFELMFGRFAIQINNGKMCQGHPKILDLYKQINSNFTFRILRKEHAAIIHKFSATFNWNDQTNIESFFDELSDKLEWEFYSAFKSARKMTLYFNQVIDESRIIKVLSDFKVNKKSIIISVPPAQKWLLGIGSDFLIKPSRDLNITFSTLMKPDIDHFDIIPESPALTFSMFHTTSIMLKFPTLKRAFVIKKILSELIFNSIQSESYFIIRYDKYKDKDPIVIFTIVDDIYTKQFKEQLVSLFDAKMEAFAPDKTMVLTIPDERKKSLANVNFKLKIIEKLPILDGSNFMFRKNESTTNSNILKTVTKSSKMNKEPISLYNWIIQISKVDQSRLNEILKGIFQIFSSQKSVLRIGFLSLACKKIYIIFIDYSDPSKPDSDLEAKVISTIGNSLKKEKRYHHVKFPSDHGFDNLWEYLQESFSSFKS